MRLFIYITTFFLVISCNSNVNNSKINISNDEISWKKNDEFPSIDYCDQFKLNSERFSCFKNKLSELILETIDLESVSVFFGNQNVADRVSIDTYIFLFDTTSIGN